ncbi:MAG: CPBP family intramembrane glutamic endopeptidase [Anaerocolumna aminovalerica]|jgi:membrane protease YdiL (CAAX protease family)|uniref:CPBP family intramembrane glutamic endopeptidase n=1 Tax=Anaerocolumna aminovalerica TaxID=1527 RepID=UPI0029132F00|nr:CPBP family intramembrane glutamic endopeptidase [Anaerocolumna aminovalerica]MDU6263691.1 CPBP family intramembrane glutamic endopeptidase [Anaerocolumna aminovalerica]
MQNIKKISLIAIILMAILSFSNLLGLKIAGLAVVVGVVFFFVHKVSEKQPFEGSGLDIGAIRINFKDKSIWFWMALPIIMDAVAIGISKLLLPEYIDHVLARTEAFVSFNKVLILIIQLAFLALGEEIAWRAFFQKQLNKALPIIPTLLVSSLLFAIGHFNQGDAVIVLYDVFFVFINSVLYGIIFYKTNNAWMSAISHFAANLFSIIILVFQ